MSFTVRHVSSEKKPSCRKNKTPRTTARGVPGCIAVHKNYTDFHSNPELGEEKAEKGREGNKHL